MDPKQKKKVISAACSKLFAVQACQKAWQRLASDPLMKPSPMELCRRVYCPIFRSMKVKVYRPKLGLLKLKACSVAKVPNDPVDRIEFFGPLFAFIVLRDHVGFHEYGVDSLLSERFGRDWATVGEVKSLYLQMLSAVFEFEYKPPPGPDLGSR